MRILIIEKDQESADKLSNELKQHHNYQVDIALNVEDGEYHINIRNYDLVLSNWNLSGGSVLEILSVVKNRYPKLPVIVLGDKNIEHEIKSFKSGASDYLVLPVNMSVLIARMQSRLKMSDSSLIEIEDLIIFLDEERITYRGKEIEVKGKPFEVFAHLARQRGQIVSKEQLLHAIWDEPELVTPNVIEVAINQIRQRIDKPLGISTIETIRRRGYKFCL